MVLIMLIEPKILSHLYALHNGHPRSVIIASLGRGFSCLQNYKHGLESAQPGCVHKRVGMLCRGVSKVGITIKRNIAYSKQVLTTGVPGLARQ